MTEQPASSPERGAGGTEPFDDADLGLIDEVRAEFRSLLSDGVAATERDYRLYGGFLDDLWKLKQKIQSSPALVDMPEPSDEQIRFLENAMEAIVDHENVFGKERAETIRAPIFVSEGMLLVNEIRRLRRLVPNYNLRPEDRPEDQCPTTPR